MKPQKSSLFGSQFPPCCDYCAHAAGSGTEGAVCLLGRCFPESGTCRRFRYDPLRRIPRVPRPIPKPDPSDFQL